MHLRSLTGYALLACALLTSSHNIAQAGLLGYWPFDNDYTDRSSANRTAQAGPGAQAPVFSTDVPLQLAGRSNSRSLDMTSANRYAEVPGSEAFYNPYHVTNNPSSSFTVSCWVKGWPAASWVPFVSKNGESAGWQLRRSGGGSELDWTTRGAATGFATGNGDFNTGTIVPNGGLTSPGVRNTQWYHFVCTFDGTDKKIYLNGQLVSQQTNAGARILESTTRRLVFGARHEDGGGIGSFSQVKLDEVALWDNALTQNQIYDLASGTDPRFLHSVATPWNLGEPWGTPGKWGVKEARTSNAAWLINNLNTAVGALMNNTGVTSQAFSVIDFKDPQSPGGGSGTAATYLTNTAVDDEDFAMIGTACLRVPTTGAYTFEFKGDDGFIASLFGGSWTVNAHNGNASASGEVLTNMVPTGDTNTYAVATLAAGDYNFRYLWFERAGGGFNRVRIASGNKTGDDGSFKLLGDATGPVTLVDQAPMLNSFTSSTYAVTTNPTLSPATTTLSWSSKYAASLSITPTLPGNPTITPGTNSVTFASPTATTTYTLTGTTGAQVRTTNLTVYVDQPPTITTFNLTDSTVVAGAPITFNWASVGASSLSIDNGIGAVAPTGAGSLTINAPAAATTYTLSATNPFGTVTAQTTVTIGLPPTIDSYTIADNAILPGGIVQLDWLTSLADTVSISPRPGGVALDGQFCENPTANTTYTLTATNAFASVSQARSVTLPGALTITSTGWNQTRISSTVTVADLATCDALLAGSIAGTTFTASGVAQINEGDGAVGVFVGGEVLPPGGNGDNFVVRSTATLRVFFTGYYTFGINNDDGGRLRINGNDVIVDNSNHGPTSFVSSPQFLAAGDHTIDYLYWEQGGGFAGEVYCVRGDGTPFLLATGMPSPPPITGSDLKINEFLTDNTQLLDAQGDTPDWIEIYNPTASPINLAGYYLTNSALPVGMNMWAFPSHSVPAGGFLVVFASLKNTTLAGPQFHTNFSLQREGGYLALTKDSGPGAYAVVDSYTYGAQRENKSYGRYDTEQYTGFFDTPSPGVLNAAGVDGFVGDTNFSVARGIKSAPFTLTIICTEPTAEVRYTTNGSTPTESTGTVYTGPVNISSTTIIRAAGFKKRWKPTNVDTHSYFFPADVLTQSAASTLADGWPLGPVSGQELNYGMDSRVVTGNQATLTTALQAIPTVSLVTDLNNLLHPTTGIYVDAGQHGENWERSASIEYINDTYNGQVGMGGAFQIDCGLRIRGGYSRSDGNPKHAFRLFFQNQYEGDLQYAIFGKEGTNRFENLDLQTSQNYSWSFDPSGASPGGAYQGYTFMREVVSRDNMRDMGQPYTRSRYVHLYINGKYWGLYMTQERAESNFGRRYLGGVEENYDVIKSAGGSGGYNTEATDGTMLQGTSGAPGSTWARLWYRANELRADTGAESSRTTRYYAMQGLQADGVTPDGANPKVLNPDNLADYMLNSFHVGSFDAPLSTFIGASNNWFAMKDRTANTGFTFFTHDNEHGMASDGDGRSDDRVGPWVGSGTNSRGQGMHNNLTNYAKSNPAYIHEGLAFSLEYRVKFADRVHKHFFNNGALTDGNTIARINARGTIMDGLVMAESARWGDSKTGGATYFTKNDWLNAKTRLTNWLNTGTIATLNAGTGPGRRATILAQLRAYKDNVAAVSTGPADPTLVAMPLYPITDGPVFGQHGGIVSNGYNLTITDPNSSNPSTSGDTRTIYYRLDEQDPREIGGGVRAGSLTGSPATLTVSGTVKARIYNTTKAEWSALTEATFVVGVAASSSNLVVSEINYNPKGPFVTPAVDRDDYEFVELWNPTASTVQLEGVEFTAGISFNFTTQSSIATLGPGERLVIVRTLNAFQQRYPDASYPGLSAKIAGVYTNSLDNGGEQLILRNMIAAADIANFTFRDSVGWPKGPDSAHGTLVFPSTNTAPAYMNEGTNWAGHALAHGNPGGPDISGYTAWATPFGASGNGSGDADGDGVLDLNEYILGTNPNVPSSNLPVGAKQSLIVGVNPAADYLSLTYTRAAGNADATVVCETTDDLATGFTPNGVLVNRVYNVAGNTETFIFRHPNPISGAPKQFMRIKSTLP